MLLGRLTSTRVIALGLLSTPVLKNKCRAIPEQFGAARSERMAGWAQPPWQSRLSPAQLPGVAQALRPISQEVTWSTCSS